MNPLRYVYAVLALLILGAGAAGVLTYRYAIKQAAKLDQVEANYASLKSDYDAFTKQVVKRDELTAAIRKDRSATTKRLDDATKADPVTRDWADTVLPRGLRDAYRQANPQRQPVPESNGH